METLFPGVYFSSPFSSSSSSSSSGSDATMYSDTPDISLSTGCSGCPGCLPCHIPWSLLAVNTGVARPRDIGFQHPDDRLSCGDDHRLNDEPRLNGVRGRTIRYPLRPPTAISVRCPGMLFLDEV